MLYWKQCAGTKTICGVSCLLIPSILLPVIKKMITIRSNLYQSILDSLHEKNIEIMSPTIMNQRRIDDDRKVIPDYFVTVSAKDVVNAEEIAFDKAEQAEMVEIEREKLARELRELEESAKDSSEENKLLLKEKTENIREKLRTLDINKTEKDSPQNGSEGNID